MRDRIAADLVLHWRTSCWPRSPFSAACCCSTTFSGPGCTCPLTPIENNLRTHAGQAGYSGGFMQHYVGRAVYPRGMPRQMELIAGVSILAGNALVYAGILAWT